MNAVATITLEEKNAPTRTNLKTATAIRTQSASGTFAAEETRDVSPVTSIPATSGRFQAEAVRARPKKCMNNSCSGVQRNERTREWLEKPRSSVRKTRINALSPCTVILCRGIAEYRKRSPDNRNPTNRGHLVTEN